MARFVVFLTLLSLASCATLSPPGEISPTMELRLENLDSWQLSGKLGYRSRHEAGSAWLDWQQQSDHFQLSLSGPFGAGATRIEGTDTAAVLIRSGEPPISASSPEALTAQLFGWVWPVDELLSWVKGIPSPASTASFIDKDSSGRLVQLHQAGWKLSFADYVQTDNDLVLPGKIIGTRDDLRFTLLIKSWQLENADDG